ncbi:MAG: hypothetical protein ACFFBD_04100 [Candidatus Hodarchaeota archaeon]
MTLFLLFPAAFLVALLQFGVEDYLTGVFLMLNTLHMVLLFDLVVES